MIDINAVIKASHSVSVTVNLDTQSCRVGFPRQIDAEVLTDLKALQSHGISITECVDGRLFEFYSPLLNMLALAEQISLCLEKEHGLDVQRSWL
jgi:hypothetical protein